ncbi:uncharacterized protein LOC119946580 [Tachyglossus aculeatus]|uniref:uncharacterized protein LOC119946580 n=1 Tax=Tachyglossus aculeatus TaxID=9261 RepID=UPI0018F2FFC5|nr:uncharacterized protein LOC119946580 [Tachyglossus aculeatus]
MPSKQVGGLEPFIRTMTADPTSYYIGRRLWFCLVGLYVCIVYVGQVSWEDLASDFQCHGDPSAACLAECFESHFNQPVLGVWHLVGFLFLSIFLAMEFLVVQMLHQQAQGRQGLGPEVPGGDEETGSLTAIQEASLCQKKTVINLHQEKTLLATYLAYFLLQLLVQLIFLVVLLQSHRPLVSRGSIWCHTVHCPGPLRCELMGTAEKLMSVILLATLSGVIILVCIFFFLYSIQRFLLRGGSRHHRHCCRPLETHILSPGAGHVC